MPKVTAILGPTNTGKTFLAMERMLTHTSGMIGFPLRLLARENYDKLVAKRGQHQVALITGEERIIPEHPRYYICTVEAMPVDKSVEFLAIDEIQLCADPDRGHVFTDRLLNARGISETMFLGSDTIRHIIHKLIPGCEITSRPRFSTLTYAGYKKITKLPKRTAIVAFSASDVYAIAEVMRRQRGGTAVVMGALSPRARNAQVGMYQAGEVDYLVATDAIGMGLNMDIDHIAFAATRKYDGHKMRPLTASEMGQIAGRAGRYMSNGTFGTTADEGGIQDELVEKIENHRFDSLQHIYWRNSNLDFSSLKALKHSLSEQPAKPFLRRAKDLEDEAVLFTMMDNGAIRLRANNYDNIKLLWDICQIPDYRKTVTEIHARFLMQLYQYISAADGHIPQAWAESQINKLDKYDGDMDTLMGRLAYIRTWTYIANRMNWLENAQSWQERTRYIEDRLSDSLHLALTQRFVDKRIAVLLQKLDLNADFNAEIRPNGEVEVEGQVVGKLSGLRFIPDRQVMQEAIRPIRIAAHKAVLDELPRQSQRIKESHDAAFTLAPNGEILWKQAPIGRIEKGADVLSPNVKIVADDEMPQAERESLQQRLREFLLNYLRENLAPLWKLKEFAPPANLRGLVYQLTENLGTLRAQSAAELLEGLTKADRKLLTAQGVEFGYSIIYLRQLFAPRTTGLRQILWQAFHGKGNIIPHMAGKIVLQLEGDPREMEQTAYLAAGYIAFPGIAVRADKVEDISVNLLRALKSQGAIPMGQIVRGMQIKPYHLQKMARNLGFNIKIEKDDRVRVLHLRRAEKEKQQVQASPYSPFAALADMDAE